MTRTGKSAGKRGSGGGSGSGAWAARQARDPFVAAARRAGFRARAVFKLEEIDRKYRLIKPGSLIVDLGAAPGSWCQYAASRVRGTGRIIAVDLLAMEGVEKVNFIRGDFTNEEVVAKVMTALNGRPPDLVLSDLAPNFSGIATTDQGRMEALQGAVLAFCRRALRPGGTLLTKLFEGESAAAARQQFAECFARLRIVKPQASRAQSREMYLLGMEYKGRHKDRHKDRAGRASGG